MLRTSKTLQPRARFLCDNPRGGQVEGQKCTRNIFATFLENGWESTTTASVAGSLYVEVPEVNDRGLKICYVET